MQRIPALEAYAAKADPAFPLVGIERCLIPSSLAIETAMPSPLASSARVGAESPGQESAAARQAFLAATDRGPGPDAFEATQLREG